MTLASSAHARCQQRHGALGSEGGCFHREEAGMKLAGWILSILTSGGIQDSLVGSFLGSLNAGNQKKFDSRPLSSVFLLPKNLNYWIFFFITGTNLTLWFFFLFLRDSILVILLVAVAKIPDKAI